MKNNKMATETLRIINGIDYSDCKSGVGKGEMEGTVCPTASNVLSGTAGEEDDGHFLSLNIEKIEAMRVATSAGR